MAGGHKYVLASVEYELSVVYVHAGAPHRYRINIVGCSGWVHAR